MSIPSGEDFVKKMIIIAKQNIQIRDLFAGCVACAVAILNDEEPTENDKEKFILCVRGYASRESFILSQDAEFYQEAMLALISHIKANILNQEARFIEQAERRTDQGDE